MINNENCSKDYFKPIHNQIYKELLPNLVKNNKMLFTRIKNQRKKKKDYNHNGSFLSQYLQNIENDMLQVLYNYLITVLFIKRLL